MAAVTASLCTRLRMNGLPWTCFGRLIFIISFFLAGCAHVEVHVANTGDIKHKLYPFGVKIVAQEGASDGVYVEVGSIGLVASPEAWGLGVNDYRLYMVDDRVCSLAIIRPSPDFDPKPIMDALKETGVCSYIEEVEK